MGGAIPKARRLGGGATLDYRRRESTSDSRCVFGAGCEIARMGSFGADTTWDHILGKNAVGLIDQAGVHLLEREFEQIEIKLRQ